MKRILVVDDTVNLLSLMRMILEDQHYQVSVLQEGKDVIEHVQTNEPDLIILDLKLADASGLDILQSLKAHSSTADIPVIVYSAAVIEAEEVENLITHDPARYAGVTVLQKPFELDALLEQVETVLGSAQPH
jgi:DNA-binding response OmpR family regulator